MFDIIEFPRMYVSKYIYIYIYIYSVHSCPQLIPLCNIAISLFDVVLESTLSNYANHCRNWTFQRFARVAEKKERNGTNEKSDTRMDLNPGPRRATLMLHIMSIKKST